MRGMFCLWTRITQVCGDESCKCGGPVITGLSVVSAGQSRSTGSDTWWHRAQNLYYVVVAMNTESPSRADPKYLKESLGS